MYTSEIAGATPCVTTPPFSFIAPTPGPSVSIITDHLFTLKYTLGTPKSSSSLATGAIAGIAVGGFAGIAFIVGIVIFTIRRRRSKAAAERDAATIKSPTTENPVNDPFHNMPNSPHKTEISEAPGSPGFASPKSGDRPMPPLWNTGEPQSPTVPIGGAELPGDMPSPQELVGSTHMDEHHPAYSPMTPLHPPSEMESPDTPRTPHTSHRNPNRDTLDSIKAEELEDESSPIYSPIGGSALLPDSPHLRAGHVRPASPQPRGEYVRERVGELERSGSGASIDARVRQSSVSAMDGGPGIRGSSVSGVSGFSGGGGGDRRSRDGGDLF